MTCSMIGDLSRGLLLRRHQSALKANVADLSEALATGRKPQLRTDLRGDFRPLAALEHRLAVLDAHDRAASQAVVIAETMQSALGLVGEGGAQLGSALMGAAQLARGAGLTTLVQDAAGRFAQAVGALNTAVAGRSLFAGAATDGPALQDADTILAELRSEIAGLTTAEEIRDAVAAWFDTPGGGYDSAAYRGAAQPAAPAQLAPNETVSLAVTATDPAVKSLLGGLAVAALADPVSAPGLDNAGRAELVQMAGARLLQADADLIDLRATLGTAQARIEERAALNAAERTVLAAAHGRITAADPYAVATELEQTQTRLETLYAITARLSRLSFADYLS